MCSRHASLACVAIFHYPADKLRITCRSPEKALVLITHYKRLLEYIQPDTVHVMSDGVISNTGGMEIVEQLELGGYATLV